MRAMKDSGVEWIGKIPVEWIFTSLCNICSVITDYVASGSFASLNENVQYLDDPNYARLVRTLDVSGKKGTYKPVYIDQQAYNFLKNSNLFGGEIILPNIGASVGDVYIVPRLYKHMSLAPNSIMIKTRYCDQYYYYIFYCDVGRGSLLAISRSTAQPKFNKTELRAIKLPVPSIEEQQRIASYLDARCDKIDTLISQEQAVIEKLQEYKQSLITRAVTKGLDPDVPMKDSGVGWIGEIPADWEIIKLKYLIWIENGSNPTTEGNIPVYGSGAISFKTCGEYKIGPTVLIGRKGATLNIPHYIKGNYWNVDTAFNVIMKMQSYILKYFYYAATCFDYDFYISSTTLPGMTQKDYGNMFTPYPQYEEQLAIADYLDARCAQIDATISTKQTLIDKLTEYKKSLIYEVVTGKKEV